MAMVTLAFERHRHGPFYSREREIGLIEYMLVRTDRELCPTGFQRIDPEHLGREHGQRATTPSVVD